MVSRVSMGAGAEDSSVVERAETIVLAAAEHLALPPPGLTPTALVHQLENLRQLLEQRIALSTDSMADSSATAQLLISILRLQCDLIDDDLSQREKSSSGIGCVLRQLQGLRPSEMIYAAPVVLSHELAFMRTMISAVRGSLWLPQRLHIENEGADAHSRRLREYVDGARIPLSVAPLETELVRKRCGALVPSPMDDKRTFKEIVEVAGCIGYIAAPITVRGRVIGILHADRPEPHGMVTMQHLEQLEGFAECLSVAFESAVLEQKVAQQRIEVSKLSGNVEGRLSGPVRSIVESASEAGEDTDLRHDRTAVPALTVREREIMAHLATGATNSQIAGSLVISAEAVKSHLKRIAKKLNTPSRAAAVAVYFGEAAADAGGRG